MFKYSILALLLIATIQQDYYLSPLYPPTAFEGAYYEVRFRVRGVDFPQFGFRGLPECFKGSSEGVLTGVPKGPGSYPVTIVFGSGAKKIQKQVIIKISPAYTSDSTFESAVVYDTTKTKSGLKISYPAGLVYAVGAKIQFGLKVEGAVVPLLWRYKNLPDGVFGDQSGLIKGTFVNPGYYSFSVQCSDSVGIASETFLTWNIQPKTYLKTSNLVQVQTQHVALQYDIDQVEKEQIAADDELFKALDIVDKKKQVVNAKKQVVAVATVAVNNAQASFNAADKAFNIAVTDRDNAQDRVRIAESALKATQQNLNLALTEQGNAQQNLVNARAAVADAQKRVAQSQIDLSAAEDRLVDAKDRMRIAEENIRTTQTIRDAAKLEYQRAFADLESAKGDLEDAKRRKQLADLAVTHAKDSLSIVQQARDDSVSALNTADFALKSAEATLAKVLDKLANIRSLYVTAKTEYGQAQWNYETALNKLYVAQARKQTADRASAIALAEGSLSDHNTGYASSTIGSAGAIGLSTSTVSVAHIGCESAAYPAISGTVRVVDKLSNGYRVSTGQQVIYGNCTQKTDCQVGDTIAYNGFLVNGIVNAQRIQRVLLS